MEDFVLSADPYNLIITGVGGQGNVVSSRIIGNMLSMKGYKVTIGETFGASQRGGSVISHLRISSKDNISPQIPMGAAHMIVSLEPVETLRVLKDYGNPDVEVISNTMPLYPVGVLSGGLSYPSQDKIEGWTDKLSIKSWFINATEKAVEIGHPLLSNIILTGALAGTGNLPLERDKFEIVAGTKFSGEKLEKNLMAFDAGFEMVTES